MGNILTSAFDKVYNFARANSLWPLTFATSCCGIEIMSAACSDYDIARFGSEIFRGSLGQADLLIVAGTITYKSVPSLLKLYEQMAEPKYVIAMGACACSGGMFKNDSYSVVYGVDKIIPVDIYLPMCPPKPEALLDALIKLQEKIKTESVEYRKKYLIENRPKLLYRDDILLSERKLN